MVTRWEKGRDGGVEPIPDWVDEDLGALALAKELDVFVGDLPKVPRKWINAALIRMERDRIQRERQQAADAAARRRKNK